MWVCLSQFLIFGNNFSHFFCPRILLWFPGRSFECFSWTTTSHATSTYTSYIVARGIGICYATKVSRQSEDDSDSTDFHFEEQLSHSVVYEVNPDLVPVFSEDPLENNRPNIEFITTIMNLKCTVVELNDVQRIKVGITVKTNVRSRCLWRTLGQVELSGGQTIKETPKKHKKKGIKRRVVSIQF